MYIFVSFNRLLNMIFFINKFFSVLLIAFIIIILKVHLKIRNYKFSLILLIDFLIKVFKI